MKVEATAAPPSGQDDVGKVKYEAVVPQPKLHWIAYLWPGLPHLWVRGSWAGLALAVGFTALLNALLATSLVWHELLPTRARWVGLAVLAGIWVLAWAEARADWRRWLAELSAAGDAEDLQERHEQQFREAQQAYLSGDWVAAEQTLRQLVRRDKRDIEARFMLATMWRRQQRYREAGREFDEIERFEAASAWSYEILRERRLLDAIQFDNACQNELTTQFQASDGSDASGASNQPQRIDNPVSNQREAPEEQLQTSTETSARRPAA